MKFSELPLAMKIFAGLTAMNTWILFEETIVDRHGLWRYMPLYRVGDPCAWDLGALLSIAIAVWLAGRRRTAS